jgi:protein MpaA
MEVDLVFDLRRHKIHDSRFLIGRWRNLAQAAGLKAQAYASAEAFRLFCFRSPALKPEGGIYLSAGIHGDEAGATEGLYQWAALHAPNLRSLPVMIFPCLNPGGLRFNRRTDSSNRDLNRCYHRDDLPQIQAQKALLEGHSFRLAMCLHEDYDATGVYLYETSSDGPPFGRKLLAAAGRYLPTDARRTLGARAAGLAWIIAHRMLYTRFPFLAEGMYLALHHSQRTITTETPSEYDLAQRIQAQMAMIQQAVELSLSL